MRLLIDMNLSPGWAGVFTEHGWEAVHWSALGAASAPDLEVMAWARTHGWCVFTHDLDYGAILAATGARGLSVVQMRSEDTRPTTMARVVTAALNLHETDLAEGAILTIDPRRSRIRILPLRGR